MDTAVENCNSRNQRLRAELETDPGEANRQQQKARERAARERADRIRQALERLPEMEAKKKADDKAKARVSTTDPEATVMKMAAQSPLNSVVQFMDESSELQPLRVRAARSRLLAG